MITSFHLSTLELSRHNNVQNSDLVKHPLVTMVFLTIHHYRIEKPETPKNLNRRTPSSFS